MITKQEIMTRFLTGKQHHLSIDRMIIVKVQIGFLGFLLKRISKEERDEKFSFLKLKGKILRTIKGRESRLLEM